MRKIKIILKNFVIFFYTQFINIFYTLFKYIIIILRYDIFLRVFFIKINQIFVTRVPQSNFYEKFISKEKQRNKLAYFNNKYSKLFNMQNNLLLNKQNYFVAKSFDIKFKNNQTRLPKIHLNMLTVYVELQQLQNIYMHSFFSENEKNMPSFFSEKNEMVEFGQLAAKTAKIPIYLFFNTYITQLEKTKKLNARSNNILDIFMIFYLPFFELQYFDLELLHSIDKDSFQSYFNLFFYNSCFLLYEQNNNLVSKANIFNDIKNSLNLINLSYHYANNNIEKYLLNLQNLNYYSYFYQSNVFVYYQLLFFNQKFYYIYHNLLFYSFKKHEQENYMSALQEQSFFLFTLTRFNVLYKYLKNKEKLIFLFKYIIIFFFFLISLLIIFSIPMIEYFSIFFILIYFIYNLYLQYLILFYTVFIEKYHTKKKLEYVKFYLSNYFVTQEQDFLYYRNFYEDDIYKNYLNWFSKKYPILHDIQQKKKKNTKELDFFFINTAKLYDHSNFFERHTNEVLFHIHFELFQLDLITQLELNDLHEARTELANVFDNKLKIYWNVRSDELEDHEFWSQQLTELYFQNATIEKILDPFFDFWVNNLWMKITKKKKKKTLYFYAQKQYYVYKKQMDLRYENTLWDIDSRTQLEFIQEDQRNLLYIQELTEIFYKKNLTFFQKTFNHDSTENRLFKLIHKKIFFLLINELQKEKKFYLTKFNISLQKTQYNISQIQKLIQEQKVPLWVIDSTLFLQEVTLRHKHVFKKLIMDSRSTIFFEKLYLTEIPLNKNNYNLDLLYRTVSLYNSDLNQFHLLYDRAKKDKKKKNKILGTIESFGYSADALQQLLNTINFNVLANFFPKLSYNSSLVYSQTFFQYYLQYTTIFEEEPKILFFKEYKKVFKKILEIAAFNSLYDFELFFYNYLYKRNRFLKLFSNNKEKIFLLNDLYFFLIKYQFNFFVIPTSTSELKKLIYLFREFEEKNQITKYLQKFQSTPRETLLGFKTDYKDLYAQSMFIKNEIITKEKSTMRKQIYSPIKTDYSLNFEVTTDDIFKYPPFVTQINIPTKNITKGIKNLAIPTMRKPIYIFPIYCRTHSLCDVDLDFDLEGLLWF